MIRRFDGRPGSWSAARALAFGGAIFAISATQGGVSLAQETAKAISPASDGALSAREAVAARERLSGYNRVESAPALIVRERIGLTLGGAQTILEAAQAKAASMKLNVNIWVVDDGGHPLAFARMDGGRPASAYTALTKAITAATFRQPTGPLPAGAAQPDILLNIAVQNAAAAGGGKITTLFGGVPIVVDGQVIGAVGVGGASGEQDAIIARAGIDQLLSAIKPKATTAETSEDAGKPTTASSSPTKPTTPEDKPADDRDF